MHISWQLLSMPPFKTFVIGLLCNQIKTTARHILLRCENGSLMNFHREVAAN